MHDGRRSFIGASKKMAASVAAGGLVLGAGLGMGVAAAAPASAAQGPYVAIGDSYSSGLGTRDYDPDSGECYRSPSAFPQLVSDSLGLELTFEACSGAEVDDVLGQLGNLDESTGYVTVSVGGNDAGFTSVITTCALPSPVTCWSEIDEANAYITDELPTRLDELYAAISESAPNASVAVVGYPRLFNGEECNVIARISAEEQAELNATADLLSDTLAAAAERHGFGYVDPRDAFSGHAVCDDTEWVNGISNPVRESYHPNVDGHSDGYAPLVQNALGAFGAA